MKIGQTFAAGLLGLSLAAFAPSCIVSAMTSATMPPDAEISTTNRPQVAFDETTEEHEEHHEEIEHGRDRTEEFTHHDRDVEHDDTRNMVRDHTPGREEHEQHERHESEEQHRTVHQFDVGD